jgi:hypothetical protein
MPKHLWEVDHPYYCNLGNYFKNGCGENFGSWADFQESCKDEDFDMNLVFRFDWQPPKDDDDNEIEFNHDENYRESSLEIFYMGQRKGLYRFVTVEVCRADEPAVIEWLKPRWERMRLLWEPFSGAENKKEEE